MRNISNILVWHWGKLEKKTAIYLFIFVINEKMQFIFIAMLKNVRENSSYRYLKNIK